MVVQLSITVGNVDQLLELGFTHIEVWASEDEGNSYQELTAPTELPAILDSVTPLNTFWMGGRLLKIQVNEGLEVPIPFGSVVEHWTAEQVVDRINEVLPGFASVFDGKVRLTSNTTGRASSILVTYSDAYNIGWTNLGIVRGKDARIPLVAGKLAYSYVDLAGRDIYRYRWRFSNGGIPPLSEFSPVVYGKEPSEVSSSHLSYAIAQFIGVDGRPKRQKIIITMVSPPRKLQGFVVVEPLSEVFESDPTGYLQISLVRGSKVRLAIEGTTFVREFVVPDQAQFDLIEVLSTVPDAFGVQAPPPLLIRRSI